MGLFDWREENIPMDGEVKEKLTNVHMLNIIIDRLKEAGSWTTECKGFYDHRARKIKITKDFFSIQDSKETFEKEKYYEDEKLIVYADYNYKALHGYYNVSLGEVILIWANVIKERMQAEFPELTIGDISVDKEIAYFTYSVPVGKFNDWF